MEGGSNLPQELNEILTAMQWTWEYDNIQAVATRTTIGPVTRNIESRRIPRMHEAQNGVIPDDGMEIDEPSQVGPAASLELNMGQVS